MTSLHHLNFLSLNVGMSSSLAGLSALITTEKLDIIFLQEVRMTSLQIESQLAGFRAVANIDHDNLNIPGTALVWRQALPVENVVAFSHCRTQVASLGTYRLINIYAPSGSNKKEARAIFFGQEIFNVMQLNSGFPLVLGGDFNCCLNSVDIENGVGYYQKSCAALQDLVHVLHLVDAFRHCH